jgi:hypothetical protein
MIAIANCGGISAPFLFPSTDSPLYVMGNWTIFAFLMVAAILTVYTWYKLGSHAGYRGDEGNLEDIDAELSKSVEDMKPAKAFDTVRKVDV